MWKNGIGDAIDWFMIACEFNAIKIAEMMLKILYIEKINIFIQAQVVCCERACKNNCIQILKLLEREHFIHKEFKFKYICEKDSEAETFMKTCEYV
jgi:hypothetical protein